MTSIRTLTVVVMSTVVLAGCGGSEAAVDPSAGTSTPPVSPGSPTTSTVPPGTAAPSPTTTSVAAPTTEPASTGSGMAVVDVGGVRYEFRVIQCLRDRPSAFGDTVIDMTLDGVPVDAPQELIEPLLGEMDPDTDLMALVEPVAAYGPLLTVSRFDGGGDYLVVYDLDTLEVVSDPDPLSVEGRFLDVPDGVVGITVSGATTVDGVPLEVSATCP